MRRVVYSVVRAFILFFREREVNYGFSAYVRCLLSSDDVFLLREGRYVGD